MWMDNTDDTRDGVIPWTFLDGSVFFSLFLSLFISFFLFYLFFSVFFFFLFSPSFSTLNIFFLFWEKLWIYNKEQHLPCNGRRQVPSSPPLEAENWRARTALGTIRKGYVRSQVRGLHWLDNALYLGMNFNLAIMACYCSALHYYYDVSVYCLLACQVRGCNGDSSLYSVGVRSTRTEYKQTLSLLLTLAYLLMIMRDFSVGFSYDYYYSYHFHHCHDKPHAFSCQIWVKLLPLFPRPPKTRPAVRASLTMSQANPGNGGFHFCCRSPGGAGLGRLFTGE